MKLHVLEKLAATNPDCEIWWDSSPLVYASWKRDTLDQAPAEKRADWSQQLTRLFDADRLPPRFGNGLSWCDDQSAFVASGDPERSDLLG